ncbi:MAG: 4-hydroxybenzoate octaprenyltransferase [Proteobacteria bacterium]|nr:4-hydroxybenzoate octaprenyltransferase [Pseudomonadota bacterium]
MTLERLYQYGLLMRVHRPVGILLLLWPTLIALLFANAGKPSFYLVMIFMMGVFLMRSAGCVINDVADRNFDGFVQRTKARPLVTKKVTTQEALLLFCLLLLASFILVCKTNINTLMLSFVAASLAILYPFTKRFIHFPQVILGAAFGWAIPMVYSASDKTLTLDCWLLFIATLLWAVAYDTIYAMVDKADDLKIGTKSTAILFGQFDKFGVGFCHALMLMIYIVIGNFLSLGWIYYSAIMLAGFFALYQQWLIRKSCPHGCFQAFLNNQWLGAVLFVGTLLNYHFF